jgi:hypothetical protein
MDGRFCNSRILPSLSYGMGSAVENTGTNPAVIGLSHLLIGGPLPFPDLMDEYIMPSLPTEK